MSTRLFPLYKQKHKNNKVGLARSLGKNVESGCIILPEKQCPTFPALWPHHLHQNCNFRQILLVLVLHNAGQDPNETSSRVGFKKNLEH